jgi:hypothetical protein
MALGRILSKSASLPFRAAQRAPVGPSVAQDQIRLLPEVRTEVIEETLPNRKSSSDRIKLNSH